MEAIKIGTGEGGHPVTLSDWVLKRHALLFGGSGYGKSYLAYLLILEQLAQGNCSLVYIDAKVEAVRRIRGTCQEAGIPGNRVWSIIPSEPESAPGFNPLLIGDPAEAAARMMELLDDAGSITGPRMRQFLRNALVMAAWHGLTLSEVPRLLVDGKFRLRALNGPRRWSADEQYIRSRDFLLQNLDRYRNSDREESALAVENKFDELLGNRLFLRLFEARKNDVDFASLFQKPGAVLVCAGKGGGVTPAGRALLSGIVAGALEAAAEKMPGNLPVILAVDEAGVQADTVAGPLSDIVNMARERGIRLLLAAQHPSQLPSALRDDLMESSAVKAYFRPGGDHAREAAKNIASGPQLLAPIPYNGKLLSSRPRDSRLFALVSEYPPPLGPLAVDPAKPESAFKKFCAYAPSMIEPLYLEDGRLAKEAVRSFPAGNVFLEWKDGYGTLRAEIPEKDWEPILRGLGAGEAVLLAGNDAARRVRITRVSPPKDAQAGYGWRPTRDTKGTTDGIDNEQERAPTWEDDESID